MSYKHSKPLLTNFFFACILYSIKLCVEYYLTTEFEVASSVPGYQQARLRDYSNRYHKNHYGQLTSSISVILNYRHKILLDASPRILDPSFSLFLNPSRMYHPSLIIALGRRAKPQSLPEYTTVQGPNRSNQGSCIKGLFIRTKRLERNRDAGVKNVKHD